MPNATVLKQTIVAGQTSAEDGGRVAQATGVGTLLSHLIRPTIQRSPSACGLKRSVRTSKGTIVVGKDLLEI